MHTATLRTGIEAPTPALLQQWDELATSLSAPPFLFPGWTRAWWRAFGRGRLELATVRSGTELLCVMPLRRGPAALRSPTNAHTPLFGPVSTDDRAVRELVHRQLLQRRRWLDLSYLDHDGALAGQLRDVARRGKPVTMHTQLRSPYVDTRATWDAYRRRLTKKQRQELGRRRRRLAERGELVIGHSDGSTMLDRLLADGFRVEGSGWKGVERSSIDAHDDTRQFYTEVARWAAERGWLRLSHVTLDGTMIAFALGMEVAGVHYRLKSGYDETYHQYGPGVMNLVSQLQAAFESDVHSFEMLGDTTDHKIRWADGQRIRIRAEAFPSTATGRGARVVTTALLDVRESMVAFGRDHVAADAAPHVRRIARRLKLL